jgi:hypothetical protein
MSSQHKAMKKIIAFLIAAIAALLPVYGMTIHPMLGIVVDVIVLFAAAAMHQDHLRDDEPAIILIAILSSILCQIAWAILA